MEERTATTQVNIETFSCHSNWGHWRCHVGLTQKKPKMKLIKHAEGKSNAIQAARSIKSVQANHANGIIC